MSGTAFPWYEHWARERPHQPAVIAPEWRLSYGELREQVNRRGGELAGRRDPGAPMLLEAAPGSRDWLLDLLAALAQGRIAVQPDQDWPRADWDEHLARVPDAPPGDEAAGGGLWLFTSGTTRAPKPRFRPRALLERNVAGVLSRLPGGLRERPVSLSILPLSHGYGLVNALFLVHAAGGTVVQPEDDSPGSVAAVLRRFPADMLYAWPAQLERLADPAVWAGAREDLRWCASSSLRLRPEIASAFARASGCPVRQQYGTTETGPLCLDDAEPPSDDTSCVGSVLEGVEMRMLKDGASGHEGELAARVAGMALPDDELTREGFWPTGDRGFLDGEGRIYVLGRYAAFTDERAGQMRE